MDAWQNSLFAGFLMSILEDFNVEEFYASSNYGLTLFLFLVFMIFVNIVMLNLLIAIMGDIFNVQENAEAEFLRSSPAYIGEIDMRISRHRGRTRSGFRPGSR